MRATGHTSRGKPSTISTNAAYTGRHFKMCVPMGGCRLVDRCVTVMGLDRRAYLKSNIGALIRLAVTCGWATANLKSGVRIVGVGVPML